MAPMEVLEGWTVCPAFLGRAGADGFPVGGEAGRLLGGSCGIHGFRLGLVWSGVITARVGPS